MLAALELSGLEYAMGDFRLGPLSLTLEEEHILSIVGPNGAGKTTLLRLVAGLERANAGTIRIRGESANRLPPEKRGIGFVFQDLALFPHMTAAENIGYGLWVRGVSRPERQRRVTELAANYGLSEILGRRPGHLSGGERQRVAIARALAPEPALVLLDEPLNSVDPENRRHFLSELKQLLRDRHVTALHVTHDLDEGSFLSNEMAVLWEGQLAQYGPTEQVLRVPTTVNVARFLGYNVWREKTGWKAAHPASFRLEDPGTGQCLHGKVIASGTTLGGTQVELQVEVSQQFLRLEFDRGTSPQATLSPGRDLVVWLTEVIPLPEPPEAGP